MAVAAQLARATSAQPAAVQVAAQVATPDMPADVAVSEVAQSKASVSLFVKSNMVS